MNGRVQAQVEELPENRVRLTVQVPSGDVHHAVEHAASDLAQSVKIPGFRKGKVPQQVLVRKVGRERLKLYEQKMPYRDPALAPITPNRGHLAPDKYYSELIDNEDTLKQFFRLVGIRAEQPRES